MQRLMLMFVFASAFALGQDRAPGPLPKLDGYFGKALENALRQPGSKDHSFASGLGLTTHFQDSFSDRSLPKSIEITQNTCAIPLLTVPAGNSADPQIGRPLNPRDFKMDSMPQVKAMRVCR